MQPAPLSALPSAQEVAQPLSGAKVACCHHRQVTCQASSVHYLMRGPGHPRPELHLLVEHLSGRAPVAADGSG